MPPFADLSSFLQVSLLLELALGLICLLAIVALRFLRRGAARFWLAPATTAVVLLPGVTASAVTVLAFRDVLRGMALVGTGSVSAIAAGSAESLLALLVGLAAVACLALVAIVVTSVGSTRLDEGEGQTGGGMAMPLTGLAVVIMSAALIILIHSMVGAVTASGLDPAGLVNRWRISAVMSAGLTLLLPALVLVATLGAPRGPSPIEVKIAALSALALAGLGALVGFGVVYSEMDCLTRTAYTGVRCDAGPTPVAEATAPSEPSPIETSRAFPVGGRISEPRKLVNVNPVYPEEAKKARVQGLVVLECTIDTEGRVASVRVLRGIPLLEEAAVDAVKRWVYTPTLLDGEPVPVIMTVTVRFQLN